MSIVNATMDKPKVILRLLSSPQRPMIELNMNKKILSLQCLLKRRRSMKVKSQTRMISKRSSQSLKLSLEQVLESKIQHQLMLQMTMDVNSNLINLIRIPQLQRSQPKHLKTKKSQKLKRPPTKELPFQIS